MISRLLSILIPKEYSCITNATIMYWYNLTGN